MNIVDASVSKYKNSRMSTVLSHFVVPPNFTGNVLVLQFSLK